MFPHENLFVGDLGKTEQPLASRFMTTPVTREVSPSWRSVGVVLPSDFSLFAISTNGLLALVGNDDIFVVISLQFDPVRGFVRAVGTYNKERNFENFGNTIKDEPVARGIDWIMTKRFHVRVDADGEIWYRDTHRAYNPEFVYQTDTPLKNFMLCTPHRHRGFSKGIPGGESNPFTGEYTYGYVPYGSSEYAMRLMHDMLGHEGEMLCDWPQTVARLGPHMLIDGFLIGNNGYYTFLDVSLSEELRRYNLTFPYYAVTPLEFHQHREDAPWFTPEDHAGGTPVYAVDYRVASAKGKLYARGMVTMGEACLIPAAFGESEYPTEYFLYIANSHGYQSPYNLFSNAPLQKDDMWENTQPILLKDVNDPEQNFLAGIVAERVSPITGKFNSLSTQDGILLPDNTRYGIGQDVFYDRTSRTGLLLDDVGAMFFGGDIENNTISNLDEYVCSTMANWLAPTREINSFSQKHVFSSIPNGTLFTNIERDFARDYVNNDLAWAWCAFEKKQDAENPDAVTGRVKVCPAQIGQYIGTLNAGVPDDVDSVPFEEIPLEQAIKNPFRLSVLNLIRNGADVQGQPTVQWNSVSDDCVLSKFYVEEDKYVYGSINPDTGEITESDSPGGIPEGWEAASGNAVFGLKPHRAIYTLPSIGTETHFAPVQIPDRHPWGIVSGGADGMIQLVESSSGMRIAWRHRAFGQIEISSNREWHDYGPTELYRNSSVNYANDLQEHKDFLESNRLGVIFNNAPLPGYCSTMKHWGSDPVTDWLGRKKFLKTLTVWILKPIYRYVSDEGELEEGNLWTYCQAWLCIMRTDLDQSVFDFDAEMMRASSH